MMGDIYWNSRKSLFSVKEKGKVILHTRSVFIENPKFVVYEAGRQRVIKKKQKNVPAFVRGEITTMEDELYENTKVRFLYENRLNSDYSFAVYNPYDEVGLFRILCVIGDIPITKKVNNCVCMVHAYVYEDKPQLKVKMG